MSTARFSRIKIPFRIIAATIFVAFIAAIIVVLHNPSYYEPLLLHTPKELAAYSSCTYKQLEPGITDARNKTIDTSNTSKCYLGGIAYQQYYAKQDEAAKLAEQKIPHTYYLKKDYPAFSTMSTRVITPVPIKTESALFSASKLGWTEVPSIAGTAGIIALSKQDYTELARQMHYVVNSHTVIYISGKNAERLVGLGKPVTFVTPGLRIGGIAVFFDIAYPKYLIVYR